MPRSADGVADFLEQMRNYHLYVLGCSSRGPLPARVGRVFKTTQTHELWDGQFWLWNLDHQYYLCYAADAFDLLEPFFGMYSRWLPNCEIAARQRWGVPGTFYPETAPFNGPKVLPEDVAKEFQDVMRGRKPAWELSDRAIAECSYDCAIERGGGDARTRPGPLPTGPLHLDQPLRLGRLGHRPSILVAIPAYRRPGVDAHERLPDPTRGHGVLPGLGRRERCGRQVPHLPDQRPRAVLGRARQYHRSGGAARAGPVAIRAAELLDIDADLRAQWKEFLDNLASYPMGSEPEARALTGGVLSDDTWAAGRLGDVTGGRNGEIVWESPVFPYEHVTLATKDVDPALWEVAWRTCQAVPAVTWGSWSRTMLNIGGMGDRATIARSFDRALLGGRNWQVPEHVSGQRFQPRDSGCVPRRDAAVLVAPARRTGSADDLSLLA